MDKKGIEKFEYNGTTLYFDTTGANIECFDIDVEPGFKDVYFDHFDLICVKIMLRNVCKVFSDVETIHIGNHCVDINISNKIFPNAKFVTGSSSLYVMNRDMLLRNHGTCMSLINTFYKTCDDVIDLKGISTISSYAFDGCKASNVINSECINYVALNAFENYKHIKCDDGVYHVGSIVTGYDKDAAIIDVPAKSYIASFAFPVGSTVNAAYIHNSEHLHVIPAKKMIICKDFISDYSFDYDSIAIAIANDEVNPECEKLECEDDTAAYMKSVDGILYSYDGLNLLKCPPAKTGDVKIPDGVTSIIGFAFKETSIDRVVCPKSLKVVDYMAFYASTISDIDFNGADIQLHEKAFAACGNLTSIKIRCSSNMLGNNTFKDCISLRDVIFEEGLEYMCKYIFAGCHSLHSITLPESFNSFSVYTACLSGFKHVILKSKTIPKHIINSIMCPDGYEPDEDNLCTLVHLCDGNTLYIPKSVSTTKYYELINKFNNLCNTPVYMLNMDELSKLYKYGDTAKDRAITALAEYIDSDCKNDNTLRYLKRCCDIVVDYILANYKEEDFIKFLKLNIAGPTALRNSVQKVNNRGYTIALAYILEYLNRKKQSNAFTI